MNPSRYLGLVGTGAWAVWALYITTQLVIVFTSDLSQALTWQSLVATVLLLASSVTVVLDAPDPFPRCRAVGVVAATIASTFLVNNVLPASDWPGYGSWSYGAYTLLLFTVALRGRILIAWGGMGALAALAVLWAVSDDRPISTAISLVDRNAGILLIGSLFALALRKTMKRIQDLHVNLQLQTQKSASDRAVVEERVAQFEQLRITAIPALTSIASRSDHTPQELLATEALLRDQIRSPALVVEPLLSAVQLARSRGVDVLLLDDSDTDAMPHAWITLFAERVNSYEGTQLTIRLRRDNRDLTALIAGDSGILDGPPSLVVGDKTISHASKWSSWEKPLESPGQKAQILSVADEQRRSRRNKPEVPPDS